MPRPRRCAHTQNHAQSPLSRSIGVQTLLSTLMSTTCVRTASRVMGAMRRRRRARTPTYSRGARPPPKVGAPGRVFHFWARRWGKTGSLKLTAPRAARQGVVHRRGVVLGVSRRVCLTVVRCARTLGRPMAVAGHPAVRPSRTVGAQGSVVRGSARRVPRSRDAGLPGPTPPGDTGRPGRRASPSAGADPSGPTIVVTENST
jgi:hypothetical protein